MFCSKCGKEIPNSSAFCSGCGYKLSYDETAVSGENEIKSRQSLFKSNYEASKGKGLILRGREQNYIYAAAIMLLFNGITSLIYFFLLPQFTEFLEAILNNTSDTSLLGPSILMTSVLNFILGAAAFLKKRPSFILVRIIGVISAAVGFIMFALSISSIMDLNNLISNVNTNIAYQDKLIQIESVRNLLAVAIILSVIGVIYAAVLFWLASVCSKALSPKTQAIREAEEIERIKGGQGTTWKCPKCETINPNSEQFCSGCGLRK